MDSSGKFFIKPGTAVSRIRVVFVNIRQHFFSLPVKSGFGITHRGGGVVPTKMEKEGEKFYQQSLAAAKTDKEKALFKRLIEEERQHYEIFANTYSHLSDTGNWFLWEERGVIEG